MKEIKIGENNIKFISFSW